MSFGDGDDDQRWQPEQRAPGEQLLNLSQTQRASSGALADCDLDDALLRLQDEGGAEIELGRGGVGQVLLARQGVLGRDVAMKVVLSRHGHGPDVEARFLREARVTGQLEHPGIVPVYALGRTPEGQLYYTMRRIRGRTMAAAIEQAASLQERVALMPHFLAAVQAVAFAHSRGVVHRDLKPQNVMLDSFGQTYVVDWGLASVKGVPEPMTGPACPAPAEPTALRLTPDLTRGAEGLVFGTPAYMAPEQAAGRNAEVDARSDVWGLGGVLFEILTGRPPRVLAQGQSLAALMAAPVPGVASLEPRAPRELVAICTKALEAEPSRRYESAAALVADLDAFVHGRRVLAYEYRPFDVLGRFARRHRAVLVVVAVACFALLGVSLANLQRVRVERDESRQLAQLVFGEVATHLAARPGSLPVVEAVTRRALAFYERLGDSELTDEEVAQMSRAVLRLQQLNADLGRPREAAALLALCERLVAQRAAGSPRLLAYAVGCQVAAASAALDRGDVDEARARLGEAAQREARGDAAWDDATWLTARVALSSRQFALAYGASALDEAVGHAAREVEVGERLVRVSPGEGSAYNALGNALLDASNAALAVGNSEAGLAYAARGVTTLRAAPGLRDDTRLLAAFASALTTQAQALDLRHGSRAAVQALQREATETFERLLHQEPQLVAQRHDYALLLLRSGDPARASEEFSVVEASGGTVDPGARALAFLLAGRPEAVLERRALLEAEGAHIGLWVLAVAQAVKGKTADAARSARAAGREPEPFVEWPRGALAVYARGLPQPLAGTVSTFADDYEAALDADVPNWAAVLERLAVSLEAKR